MRRILLISLLLLQPVVGWGCESYEECMEKSPIGSIGDDDGYFNFEMNKLVTMRAIAYKLDEISEKLDKQDIILKCSAYGKYASAGCIEWTLANPTPKQVEDQP